MTCHVAPPLVVRRTLRNSPPAPRVVAQRASPTETDPKAIARSGPTGEPRHGEVTLVQLSPPSAVRYVGTVPGPGGTSAVAQPWSASTKEIVARSVDVTNQGMPVENEGT